MEKTIILNVNKLNVSYNQTRVLRDLCFSIYEGEIFGLIGESGCGKSTTARAISGLIKYSGDISLKGEDIKRLNRLKRSQSIQMIFQNPYNSLNPTKKIFQILEEPLIIHKMATKKEREKLVNEMLEQVGLNCSIRNKFVQELSGGQRQRVSIGCALMLQLELLIADEVLSALDVSVQSHIINILSQLNKQKGTSFLFISHDINAVSYLCHRTAVMYKGEIVEIGKSEDIYFHPQHLYTKQLVESSPKMVSHKLIT